MALISRWNFSEISTLFQDSAKTSPVTANGQRIGAVEDSVSDNDAIQATSDLRFTFLTNQFGSRSMGKGDGTDDTLRAAINGSSYTQLTISGVFKSSSSGTDYKTFISWHNANAGTPFLFIRVHSTSFSVYCDGNYRFTETLIPDKVYFFVLRANGSVWKLDLLDEDDNATTASYTGGFGAYQAEAIYLNFANGFSGYSDVKFGELKVKNDYLDDTATSSELSNLKNTWEGVPLSVSLARSASSVNSGSNVVITPTISGGDGSTKSYLWEESLNNGSSWTTIDTSTSGAKTFTAPGAGAHLVRLTVTDDSGSDTSDPIAFFVGTVTGANVLANSEVAAYTTNVPNPVWTEEVGNGSFSSNNYTAAVSGVETATIKATNSENADQFATKQIIVGYPRRITTTNLETYIFNSLPSGKNWKVRGRSIDISALESDWSEWEEIST